MVFLKSEFQLDKYVGQLQDTDVPEADMQKRQTGDMETLTDAADTDKRHGETLTDAADTDTDRRHGQTLTDAADTDRRHGETLTDAADTDTDRSHGQTLTDAADTDRRHGQTLTDAADTDRRHGETLTNAERPVPKVEGGDETHAGHLLPQLWVVGVVGGQRDGVVAAQ